MHTRFFLLYGLFIIWFGLMGIESIKISLTFIIVLIVYLFSLWIKIIPNKINFNLKTILYFVWLLQEICKSTFTVIKVIWQQKLKITPTFEWIDAEGLSEVGAVIYGNSITLAPGTITLDINNNMLLVHALDKSSIKDLQKGEIKSRIQEINII